MAALLHDAAEHSGLVAEHAGGLLIEAELERHRLVEESVLCLPDLAEATQAKQLDQLPVADTGRAVARLEARHARRQQREKVVGLLDREDERELAEAGNRLPQRATNGGGHLGEISAKRLPNCLRPA